MTATATGERTRNQTLRAGNPRSTTAPSSVATLDLVIVGGGGHVGLPLALSFAQAGLRVGIYDLSEAALATIGAGRMPFREAGADDLLREILPTGRLVLASDPAIMRDATTVIVVVGTPIDEFFNPVMALFDRTADQLAPHLQPGTLVVLRSTVYPGTTAYFANRLRTLGCDVDVAFCPERIVEGKALEEIRGLPQIIGADEKRAGDRAEELFEPLAASMIRTPSREAELSKLYTNVWRYVKFAVANQFFMIADAAGIDYNVVLRAVRQDYPRAADLPDPGLAAGPCLFKDTMQLVAFTSDHFPLGQSAMLINEGMPAYIVAAMKRHFGSLAGRTVGILGMAFKAESDDTRASLSYKLRKLLAWEGATILCTDPYVRDATLLPLDEVLDRSEMVVIGAPHRAYRSLELGERPAIDIWNCLGTGIRI